MNQKYSRKLQSALIAAGKVVESKLANPSPEIPAIELLYDQFLQAVDKDDLAEQKRTSMKLIAALLKYQIEKL